MNVSDILSEISDHGFTDTSTTRKMALLNDTVWEVCSRRPWPFLEGTITLTFDGVSAVPTNVPADFHSVVDLIDPSTGQALQPLELEYLDKTQGSSLATVGTPQAYYFIAGQLNLYQVPTAGYTLRMRYLRIQQTLSSGDVEAAILVPARHHRVLVLGTLWKLYDLEDDSDLAMRFQQNYETRIAQMAEDIWMRQWDRPDRIHVVDNDDDFDTYWYA